MSEVEAEKKLDEEEKEVEEEEEDKKEKGGELLFCGSTCWDLVGRRKGALEGNLVSPTRLRPLVGVDIRFVSSGCASCHCVVIDVEGRCYTWGRSEKGQLGHGDKIQRDRPTVVSELSKYTIKKAGAGRSHTIVVTEDGQSFAFGWNKHGQLGSGSVRNEFDPSPVHCLVSEVTNTACGAEFTVWLSSVQGASILTAGLPQYGQLGNGMDNEAWTESRKMSGSLVVLMSFRGTMFYLLMQLFQLVLLTLRVLQVVDSCTCGANLKAMVMTGCILNLSWI